jgi:hypothetical protein
MTDEFKAKILAAMAPLEGWCTLEKAIAMADIILEHKPSVVVETGIFGGKSIIPLAMAVREVGCGLVYGIDPWTKEAALEGQQEEAHIDWWGSKVDLEAIYLGFVKSTLELGLGYHLRWLRMSNAKASRLFSQYSINFFHQDSNHAADVSLRDAKRWAPLLKKKSFWVVDDCDWASVQPTLEFIKESGFISFNENTKYKIFRRV